jgi:hypothetical protein
VFVTAAGWYPDPTTGQQRYFDGVQWGPAAPPVQQPGRFTIHYGFALLAVFALIGTLFPALSWIFAGDPNTSSDDFLSTVGVLWLFWGGMWTVIWTAFAVQHTLKSRRT